jgi:cobalt-zinc-cadmium efflux system protein
MPEESLSDDLRRELVEKLKHDFSIQYVTIQVEKTETECNDACHNPRIII